MNNLKRAFWATTALVGGVLAATAASAQSTGSETFEENTTTVGEVVVTGARGPANVDGLAVAETVTRARSTLTQEYLETQQPGQTVLQSLNILPGVTFNNQDAYGGSGGDITIRGFDAQRISLNLDGIQLNDTGNYQIYSNQQVDPELFDRVSVNQGTTDVDSPTASATGGTINMVTRRPGVDPMIAIQPSIGSFNYRRIFLLGETGELGPWGTRMWAAYSHTEYDQFRGPGELIKDQYNARIWQPLGDNGDFLSVAFHYNENRNHFYTNASVDAFNGDSAPFVPGTISPTPNTDTCTLLAPVGGTRQDQGNNAANPGCQFYYNYAINPSNTGNIRGQSRFTLSDSLTLTIDPTFQYVLANGGGITNVEETDQRLQGTFFNPLMPTATGVDLNGDGDILDRIKLYSPSNTNTRRYSVNSSLIWDITDDHRVRFAYTWDRGNHRQTSEFGYLDTNGDPENVFGGKDGYGRVVLTRDGDYFQERNRQSIALLNQFAVEYSGSFMDDTVRLNIGVRAPFFERELNNYCWQTDTFNAWCSRQRPVPPLVSAGASATAGAPVSFTREYDAILPNIGASWEFAPGHTTFFSYAENLSAPRTDDLYDRVPANPDPERSRNYDLGYRYAGGDLIVATSIFRTDFENFIVRGFETLPDLSTIAYSINAGEISRWGWDGQIGYQVTDAFSVFASASWIQTEIESNIPNTSGGTFATAGNELPEVPQLQWALRGEYDFGDLTLGAQAKYVDERWTNLVNDEATPSYTVVDLDARWSMDAIREGMFLQVNVQNLFDEDYLANISTAESGNRTASIGAPRSVSATLRFEF
ncbi:TonB-dependent receptor [Brevundimonas sp.]|uniref:TonB-dependent receptor n=1 Tax=Brevundimonas sp. TaxID=1871086 RepID=UPI0025EFABEA|nr:TonB-dependent receptor [Brevundimonas sp.]